MQLIHLFQDAGTFRRSGYPICSESIGLADLWLDGSWKIPTGKVNSLSAITNVCCPLMVQGQHTLFQGKEFSRLASAKKQIAIVIAPN